MSAVDAYSLIENQKEDRHHPTDQGVESNGVWHYPAPGKVNDDRYGENQPHRSARALRVRGLASRA